MTNSINPKSLRKVAADLEALQAALVEAVDAEGRELMKKTMPLLLTFMDAQGLSRPQQMLLCSSVVTASLRAFATAMERARH